MPLRVFDSGEQRLPQCPTGKPLLHRVFFVSDCCVHARKGLSLMEKRRLKNSFSGQDKKILDGRQRQMENLVYLVGQSARFPAMAEASNITSLRQSNAHRSLNLLTL